MSRIRISSVTPLDGVHLRLTLTNGSVIERDVEPLLVGPVIAVTSGSSFAALTGMAECQTA